MVRLCRSLSLLLLAAGLVLVAAPVQATEVGQCAAMNDTIVRGVDFLYVNAHCDDGSSAHHPKITGFEPDPAEPLPPAGWNPQFSANTNFMMDTNDVIAGRGVYRVHIVWLNSDETIAYDTAYVTVTFQVHSASDLGVADLAHHGSTARGGTGAYTFTVTNSGQTANDVSYDLTLSPGASAPSPPADCSVVESSIWATVVRCTIATLIAAPRDVAITVVNPPSGDTAAALVSVTSLWAEEPDDDDDPNQAALTFALSGAAPNPGSSAPVKVKPKLTKVGKAKVKGSKVKFSARVSFTIPQGQSAATACSGKVTGSTKASGVAKASKSKKGLAAKHGSCTAKMNFMLPKSFLGQKVKVKVSFPGSSAIKAFTKSARLKIGS